MAILRQPAVSTTSGNPKSTLYWRVSSGTFPRPVKIGARASGWIKSEVEAIVAARIAGKSDDEVRTLVAELHAARKPLEVPK
jgi:prophage regulatory protein